MKCNIITTLLLPLALIFAGESFAGHEPRYGNFDRQIYIMGVGQARLKYHYVGEPISRPRLLEVLIKCENSQSWMRLIEYQMCDLDEYHYEPHSQTLSIKYLDGRVRPETGESFCDQKGDEELPLADVCKTRK